MKKILFPVLVAIILFSACTRTDDGPGKLVIKVTDDPFNISFVESATVKISKVEIRKLIISKVQIRSFKTEGS